MKENICKVYHKTFKAYENIASEYALKNQSPSLSFAFINEFIKNLSPGDLILDAGCGHGRDIKLFNELGYKAIGIDYSSEMVRIAKKNVPESESNKIIQMNLLEMEFKPSYFDGIWSNAVLHHFSDNDIENIVHKFHVILKPKGILFVSARKNLLPILDSEYSNNTRYYNSIDAEKIVEVLEKSKFSIDKIGIQNLELKTWIQVYASK